MREFNLILDEQKDSLVIVDKLDGLIIGKEHRDKNELKEYIESAGFSINQQNDFESILRLLLYGAPF